MNRTGKRIESMLLCGLLIGLVVRDGFGFGRFDHGIMIFGTLLGLLYLLGEYWVNKPDEKSARTIFVTILFGLTSWLLLHSFYFKLLYLPGSNEIGLLGAAVLIISLVVDFIFSINRTKVLSRRMIQRSVFFTVGILVLTAVPEDSRLELTYRNYPEFLEHYHRVKGTKPFDMIYNDYFDKN